MHYSFCDLKFSISFDKIYNNPIYIPFRNKNSVNVDFDVPVRFTECLGIPQKAPIFQNAQGLCVVLEKFTEYRYYRDFFTGEIREMLIDNGDYKELVILEDIKRHPLTELELINCLALEKTMSEYGKFILHSSYIETPKGAVLFTAPSGTGKSTQAELWNQYRGTEIINGDRAGIWKDGNVWMAGGVPWCGTSGIMKNKIMPLRAIVILKQATKNVIQEIRFSYKVKYLLEQLTINPWNKKMLDSAQVFCMLLCQEIPIISLACRPDMEAVDILEQELERVL